MFNTDPNDEEILMSIMNRIYRRRDKLPEFIDFTDVAEKKYQEQPRVMGNIYLNKAMAYHYLGKNYAALDTLDSAENEYKKVLLPGHPNYDLINQIRQDIKSKQ